MATQEFQVPLATTAKLCEVNNYELGGPVTLIINNTSAVTVFYGASNVSTASCQIPAAGTVSVEIKNQNDSLYFITAATSTGSIPVLAVGI